MTAMNTIRNMVKKMGKGSIALLLAVLFVLLAGMICVAGAEEPVPDATATIKVIWDDNDNAAGKRPSSLSIYWRSDINAAWDGRPSPNSVSDSNNWEYTRTFTGYPVDENLFYPEIYSNGIPAGYRMTAYEVDEETNTYTWTLGYQQTGEIRAILKYDDMDDAWGRRPGLDDLTIGLYGLMNGRWQTIDVDELIDNKDGTITAVWNNVTTDPNRSLSIYTITGEVAGGQYTVVNQFDYSRIQPGATLKLRTTRFGGQFNFRPFTSSQQTATNMGTPIPESFTLQLLDPDGNVVVNGVGEDAPICEAIFETFPLNGGYGNPPRKSVNIYFDVPYLDENGEKIDYSGYHVEYVDLPPYVLYESERDIYIPGIVPAEVRVEFSDSSNQFGTRPTMVNVEYREKNGLRDPIMCTLLFNPTETSNYKTSSVSIPQITPEGEILEWEIFVEPEGDQWYDRTINADLSLCKRGPNYSNSYSRYHKINYTLKTTKVRAQVIWDDENDAKNTRPDDVVVTVMTHVLDEDGNKVTNADGSLKLQPVWEGASAVLNDTNEWKAEWTLPVTDAEGNELEYYVQQGQLPVHVTTYHAPEDDADGVRLLKITNVPLDAWNYAIDLRWETNVAKERYHRYEIDATDNATRTLKYELTVNTSTVDYNPGMMEVRMPYYLCETNTGKWVAPSQVSVPMQPSHNDVYSFHYYIDDHGTEDKSDDEIVYVNWKEMEAGTNQTLTVIYKVTPFEMIDTKVWELMATGYARNEYQEDEQLFEPEVKQSATISYGIDTGAQLTAFVKSPSTYYYDGTGFPDNGGKPMYYYDTTYFDSKLYPKENFDPTKYHYVGYVLQAHHSAYNQPFHFHFEEHPEDGGKVVSVKYRTSSYSVGGIENLAEDLTSWDSKTVTSCNGRWSSYSSYYVVVAWPINPDAEDDDELVYENNATATMIADVEHEGDKGPTDYHDLSTQSARAYTTWEDYEFSYTGSIYSNWKNLRTGFPTAGFTLNKFGTNTRAEFYTETTVNGFNLDGYKFNMTDHDLYLQARYPDNTYTDFVRIGDGDYYLSYVGISVKQYDYDRSTGEQIPNQSLAGKTFTLQVQKGKYGEWETVRELTYTQAMVDQMSSTYTTSISLPVNTYTGFRVLSPEGLEGYIYLRTDFYVNLRADSPVLAEYLADYDDISYVYLYNFNTMWLDVLNDEGEYYWFNPVSSYKETDYVAQVGLDDDDLADYGALPQHSYSYTSENKVGPNLPSRVKSTLSQSNDTVNGMVRGKFRLQAGEYQSFTQMPAAYYEAMSIDDGVFYDLLPTGWIFDETQPIRAYGSYDSSSYPASVTYEIIDDFKGTGRQMVIFKVKSERAAGQNYYKYSSSRMDAYLNVEYFANITWNELRYHRNGVNLMAFQEGDGTRPGREFYVGGSYGTDQYGDDGLPNESYIADYFKLAVGEDGNYAFYDINNDGVTDRNDTLMYYSTVSPEVAMTVETGIYKLVKGDSGLWKKHDTTHTDGTYRYKLGVTTSDGGDTSNLVIYDVLEDATNVEGFSGETGWKGTFVGLDLRLPKSQGIAPVVYYSTRPGLIFANENTDMNYKDASIWSTTPPADLSKVTAIAVDLTTRVDGEPFVFEGQGTTEFEIIMKAPSEVPDVRLAYNRLAYSSDFLTYGNVEAQHKYNIGKRVTIELRDLQDIQFYKLGEMDTVGENAEGVAPIGGLRFDLFKCSHVCNEDCAEGCIHTHSTSISSSACWTNTPFRTVYSESDGLVNFVRLDTGSYAVREPSARTGYQSISSVLYVFDVDASNSTVTGPVRIGGSDVNDMYAEGGKLYLKNIRTKKKIYLYKNWQSEASGYKYRPEKVIVDLYRNGELYMEGIELTEENRNGNTQWRLILEDLMLYDPYGTYYTYTFVERPVDGYELSSQSQPSNSSTSPSAYLYNKQLGVVEIGKTVVNGDEDKLFTFRMQLDADANGVLPTGDVVAQRWKDDQLVARTDVTISETGVIQAQCKHGEILRFVGLPLGYSYTISEVAEDGYVSEVTSGSVTGSITNTSPAAVMFTNTYDASGELPLSAVKTVNGQTPAADESFTFTLTSGEGTPAVSQEKTNAADGSITFDTIEYGLSDAGNTYTYTVQETSVSGNGYSVDETVYTVTVQVTDNGDGTLTPAVTIADGTDEVEEITFENTYEATGELPLSAVKTVNGEEPRADQVFEFQLIGANQTVLQTVSNNGSRIDFETLAYDLDDVAGSPYTYTVKESTTDGNGYTVDTTVYTLFVWLEDNRDGTLNVTSLIKKGGETVDTIAFDNRYEASGEYTPVAQKTVNGGEPRADQVYSFGLCSMDAVTPAVSETVSNNGGEIAFSPLSFTLADAGNTYTYQVAELSLSNGHLVMDDTIYTLQLQIEDNLDGTLRITPTISNGTETVETIVFRNMVYAPLTISKTVEGPETDETFPVTIRLYNADGTESTETYTYTGSIQGTLQSGDVVQLGHEQSIVIEQLLPGMTYTVEEAPGIRYTATVNGQAQTAASGTCAEGGNAVTFVNTLKTTGISVVKEWQGGIGGDIQLVLYANGVKVEPQPAYHQDGQTYSYINLPMYDTLGQLITYSVKEKYMDGYLTIYQNVAPHASETECVYNGGTIINREVITFRIRKVWSGLGDEPAPPIQLTLYCNGTVYDRDQPTPDEDGWYVYRNLPKYVNGERAQYTIKETAMSGYETYYFAIDGSRAEIGYNGGKINNVKLPDTGDRSHPEWWIALAVLAVCAMGALVIWNRRRR